MRVFFLFSLLVVISGFAMFVPIVVADSHNAPSISVSTELSAYGNGVDVVITGTIQDYDPALHSEKDITFVIYSPNRQNIMLLGNFLPNPDGTFEHIFIGGIPSITLPGNYTYQLNFGGYSAETIIVYTGGDPIKTSEPTPEYLSIPEQSSVVLNPKMTMKSANVFTGTIPVSLSNIVMLVNYQTGATIQNISSENVDFVFYMEIDDGTNKSEAYFEGVLKPHQEHTPGFGWIPESSGQHTITFYLWNNLNDKQNLASPISLEVNVKEFKPGNPEFTQSLCAWAEQKLGYWKFIPLLQNLVDTDELSIIVPENAVTRPYDPKQKIDDSLRITALKWCDGLGTETDLEKTLQFLVIDGHIKVPVTTPQTPEPKPVDLEIASFVDKSKDPKSYVDRYNNEPSYKEWFHENYPQYDTIEQAVGLELTEKIPGWVKNIFGWYAADQVSEDELLNAIKYLINEKILIVN